MSDLWRSIIATMSLTLGIFLSSRSTVVVLKLLFPLVSQMWPYRATPVLVAVALVLGAHGSLVATSLVVAFVGSAV